MDVLGGRAELIRSMASGAGHDSVYASRHCPTSMIFVSCREGISHNPREWGKLGGLRGWGAGVVAECFEVRSAEEEDGISVLR